MMITDPHATLAAIRQHRSTARRRRRYRSRLDRYRAEILALRYQANATIAELVCWLRSQRCKVAGSTVSRYLRRLLRET